MAKKLDHRIEPYPTAQEVKHYTRRLIIAIIILLPLFIIALLSNNLYYWVFFTIFLIIFMGDFVFLSSARGFSYFDLISAYKKQNDFHKLSDTANAKVLERSGQAHGFWLTISFTANTISKGAQEQQLIVNVSQTLYQNAGETIAVRYSTLNPRIATLEGEEGFYRKHPPIRQ